MAVVVLLFAGCTTDTTDTPKMEDVGQVELSVSVQGENVRALTLPSFNHTVVVDVTLNNDNIYWTPEADQPWCQIVEEEHRGSGSFTIEIERNDSFDDRATANIKIVAGEYEQEVLTVDHLGNIFVVDKPYLVANKGEGSATIKVQCRKGLAWDVEPCDWITATKGAEIESGDFVVTDITLAWAENSDASRYAEMELQIEGVSGSDGKLALWQYGSEYNYDENGLLLLPAEEVTPLELRAPQNAIKKINVPNWVSASEPVENGDGTVSYMLSFNDNPSDAQFIRPSQISLEMVATGTETILLPEIRQEYYSIGGLLTGAGFQRFAEVWAEDGDISSWCIDGVPTLVGDVDMSLVENWAPIGTQEKPFDGKLNGAGYKIQYFNSNQPLFGYCAGAEFTNITFDSTCVIAQKGAFEGTITLAPLATELGAGCVVSNCSSYAEVSVDGIPSSTDYVLYIGGLVGKSVENATISNSQFYGTINTVEYAKPTIAATDNSKSYIGGIVAVNSGLVENCTSEGEVTANAYSRYLHMGGIVAIANGATSVISNNRNVSTLNYNLKRQLNGINDISRYGYVGGIVGAADGTVVGNENEGDIISTSNIKLLYLGGIAALVNKVGVVLQNNNVANRADIQCNGDARYAYMGSLIGYINKSITLDFTEDTGVLSGYIQLTKNEADKTTKTALGGLIGHADGTDAAINVKLIAPKWSGKILYNFENRNSTAVYHAAGGIVGAATACTLEIDGAEVTGDNISFKVVANTNTIAGKVSSGGIVGYAEAYNTRVPKITIANSTNHTPINWNTYNKKSNGYPSYSGGIFGGVVDGVLTITNCHNKADIYNGHYNNNAYTQTGDATLRSTICATGGIVGMAGIGVGSTSAVVISGCSNTANIDAYRAAVGGIAGYVANATCSDCTFTDNKIGNHESTYAGGIAGVVEASNISNCKVVANIKSTQAGSCNPRSGGIVGWASGEVEISSCRYFGTLSIGKTTLARPAEGEFTGGIAGVTTDACSIIDCKFGGKLANELDETMNATITAENYADYVVGISSQSKGACPTREVTGCGYWDGASE